MKNIPAYILLILMSLFTQNLFGQNPNDSSVEMANALHQNGKIYLVVLVLVTIFAGVLYMLVRIERKLSKLEKEKTNH